MKKGWLSHLKHSKIIKRLLYKSELYNHLYWYNKPINDFFGFKGLWIFLKFSFSGKRDEISANYNLKSLYFGKAIGDGLTSSGATTWNYTMLKNDPIIEQDSICTILETHAKTIIQEFKAGIEDITIHPDNADLAEKGEWSGIFLYGVGGQKNARLGNHFQKTFEIIEKLPISKNFGFVLISKLAPGTHIKPHCGSSNLRFRYHLGIEVPEPDQVKIRVGSQWKGWKTGSAFGFDDSFEHEVVHEGSQDRVVLIVDTWNPALSPKEIKILDNPIFHSFGKA